MTVLIEDPLIAAMAIRRTLPLHESSRRLRELYPECPRVYGVAVMGDLSRRRWWPLAAALTTWVAHRSHRALDPLFARLYDVCGGAMSIASMWHIVGGAVVSAATQVPLLAGSSELTSMRRTGDTRRAGRIRAAGPRHNP